MNKLQILNLLLKKKSMLIICMKLIFITSPCTHPYIPQSRVLFQLIVLSPVTNITNKVQDNTFDQDSVKNNVYFFNTIYMYFKERS